MFQRSEGISKKQLKVLGIICGLVLLVMVGILAYNLITTSGYVKVKAEITGIIREQHRGSGTKKTSYENFILYEYTYKEKQYESKQQVFTRKGKAVGDRVVVYCNPDNPEELRNTLLIKVGTIFSIFLILVTAVILKAYHSHTEDNTSISGGFR